MAETTLPPKTEKATAELPVMYCANHPDVETLLRCNKCSKPICMKCAVQTPVGYRCRECVRQQQNVYFNAESWDYPIAFVVSFLVTLVATPLASAILGRLGIFFGVMIALFIGAGAGSILAQIIRRAVRRRRGRYLPYVSLAGILLGVLLGGVVSVIFVGAPLFSIPMLVFAFLAITTAYPFLR